MSGDGVDRGVRSVSSKAPVVPGSAERLLAAGVSLLAPQETVVRSMLEGWMVQQRSRMLAGHTIDQRRQLVRRFAGLHQRLSVAVGRPADVEEWTAAVGRHRAWRTRRCVTIRWRWRCSAPTSSDPRYRWVEVCEQQFGVHPVQVFHEWNTVVHRSEFEGRPGNRPLTREELQAFFDHCDARVGAVHGTGRKGWLAAYRDAVLFKVIYAWGLRRREAAMLETWTGRPTPPRESSAATAQCRCATARRSRAARRADAPC